MTTVASEKKGFALNHSAKQWLGACAMAPFIAYGAYHYFEDTLKQFAFADAEAGELRLTLSQPSDSREATAVRSHPETTSVDGLLNKEVDANTVSAAHDEPQLVAAVTNTVLPEEKPIVKLAGVGAGSASSQSVKDAIDQLFGAYEEEKRLLESKVAELAQTLGKEKASRQAEITAKTKEIDQLTRAFDQQLAEKEGELKTVLARAAVAEGMTAQKQREINSLTDSVNQLQQQHKQAADAAEQLTIENDDLRNENGHLNIQLSDLRRLSRKQNTMTEAAKSLSQPVALENKPVAAPVAVAARPVTAVARPSLPAKTEAVKADSAKPAESSEAVASPLDGFKIIGLANNTIVAMKNGMPVTVNVGSKWNGVTFKSVDIANGLVVTSRGTLKVEQ